MGDRKQQGEDWAVRVFGSLDACPVFGIPVHATSQPHAEEACQATQRA